jgi:F0F1-type ATP synthase assembly protein I
MNHEPEKGASSPANAAPSQRKQGIGRAYQAAFEAVIAVVVAGAAGGFADQRFGTAPLLLMLGVLLGFGTFVLRLVRLMKELAPPPQDPGGPGGSGEGG